MSRDLHTLRIHNGGTISQPDSLGVLPLPQQAYNKGNGGVTAVGSGTPGSGYQSIPTVAISAAASGAKDTGSGATATAVMGLSVLPAIQNAGSNGTPGACVMTGTDGTGTKYQVSGVVGAGSSLTSLTAIAVAGDYTALPSNLSSDTVTGGGLSGCTLNIAGALGVMSYTVGAAGTLYPDGFTSAVVSGGSAAEAAVPGGVTISSIAGESVQFDVAGLALPATYGVFPGDPGQDAVVHVTSRTQSGFRVVLEPRLATSALTSGAIDLLVID